MNKKFDIVIGNPPYQEDAVKESMQFMPVYHEFMDAAYEVANKAVLITPARFLFNAGYTPKSWNKRMLNDPHLSAPYYEPDAEILFPGTNITGGIVVTYHDATQVKEPIGTFTAFPELRSILRKITPLMDESLSSQMTTSFSYRYTTQMHEDHPSAAPMMASGEQYKINTRTFEQLSFLYHKDQPQDAHGYIRLFGLIKGERTYRWIRSDYVSGSPNVSLTKVAIPASRGHLGTIGDEAALVVGYPELLGPDTATTQSFITIGAFQTTEEGGACLNYVKSKFARAMVGILKATQHNARGVWKYVPLQDFTENSNIDWTKPIPEIDQQLYAKYGLNDEEIEFIESHVKPME